MPLSYLRSHQVLGENRYAGNWLSLTGRCEGESGGVEEETKKKKIRRRKRKPYKHPETWRGAAGAEPG